MTEAATIPFDRANEELAAQVPERFTVCDEASANWVTRRITEARAYAKRVQQWAEQEKRRAKREETFFLQRFGSELRAWLDQELTARGSRQKSINLPAGRVGVRTRAVRLVIEDEAAVLAWAREQCPDAVVVAETFSKSKLKEHVEATGELPAGTTLEPAHDALYITPGNPGTP